MFTYKLESAHGL